MCVKNSIEVVSKQTNLTIWGN